jgi:hypothetical protein
MRVPVVVELKLYQLCNCKVTVTLGKKLNIRSWSEEQSHHSIFKRMHPGSDLGVSLGNTCVETRSKQT